MKNKHYPMIESDEYFACNSSAPVTWMDWDFI